MRILSLARLGLQSRIGWELLSQAHPCRPCRVPVSHSTLALQTEHLQLPHTLGAPAGGVPTAGRPGLPECLQAACLPAGGATSGLPPAVMPLLPPAGTH